MADKIIRKIDRSEIKEFLPLILDVYFEYEAPDHPESAKDAFINAVCDEDYLAVLTAYGAFKDSVPAGIIATRNEGRHIALFFVDGKYHKQGIGRELFNVMLDDNPNKELTVHSSIYAVPVYEKLGFLKNGDVQTESGITYLPMVLRR